LWAHPPFYFLLSGQVIWETPLEL